MKIFADHCVHTDVIDALRKLGVELQTAKEVGLAFSSDEKIFNFVLKSSQILLTFDKHFGNILRFDIRKLAGVVIVYIDEMPKQMIPERIVEFFKSIKESELRGKLFIIEPTRIRIWPK